MTNLATPRTAPSPRALFWTWVGTGALLGTVLWLQCIAFGIPTIAVGSKGYNALPLAALAGGLLGLTRAYKLLWIAAAGLAVAIAAIAYTPLIGRPARALIRSDPVGARPLDAVVVLSSTVSTDGHLRDQSIDRLLTGLALVRRGAAGTLILSRVRVGHGSAAVTSDADQQRLVALLERPVRLLVVDSTYSTRDEAVRMRALAQPLGITSVAVVTSPLHTSRSCATFSKVGFAVTCVPSESRDVALSNLRAATDRMRAFQLWLYEQVALATYRARGWV